MVEALGYAARNAGGPLEPYTFERREMRPDDVMIEITHCGICHSDLHAIDDELGGTRFPIVPGHEIVGKVVAVGDEVTRFALGDIGAIGCFTDSCRVCSPCQRSHEHLCEQGFTPTFNGNDRKGGLPTYGGYSNCYVADENYVLRMPAGLDPAAAAPLLCAGITTYSPLRKWKVGPGMRVGVVGLGGLGHIGVKLAVAMGAEVAVITSSPGKTDDARALGASAVILSSDPAQIEAEVGTLDFILDTVSAPHDLNILLALLKPLGTLCLLGIAPGAIPINTGQIVFAQKSVSGSLIGGIAETQEMLDFCAEHGITADIELIRMDEVNEAYQRIRRNDVKYRFVIDMGTLKAA